MATLGDNDDRDEEHEQHQPLMSGSRDDRGDDGGDDGGDDDDYDDDRRPSTTPSTAAIKRANGRFRPLKFTEKLWIAATIFLVSFLSFSSQLFILVPYWINTPGVTWTDVLVCLVPFNLGVAAIFYNYYLVVFTNPGSVPPAWQPDWDSLQGVEVKASTGAPRYCKVCRSYKPPRAHHCRTCKRCVLRMDHHCPWVANCVGHANYGHFLRFLYAVDFTMCIHLLLLCLRVADWWSPMVLWREPSTTVMVLLILNFAQGVPVLLMVGVFSMYHTYALCTNTTTIESWEKDKVATLVRRGKIEEIKYPYDVGIKRNIQSVLGRRALFWLWPGQEPLGTGLEYSLADGHDYTEQFTWPPRDPARPKRSRGDGDNGSSAKGAWRLPASGPFTYGADMLNPALRPSNRAEAGSGGSGGIGRGEASNGLRRRSSPDDGRGGDKQWYSDVPPYHPDFGCAHARSRSSSRSSRSSTAEEAGVVDAGCIPPGTVPFSGVRPGDARRDYKHDDGEPEEHELADAAERRKWGAGSGEAFPRLFAEASASEDDDDDDELGSEGYRSSEDEGTGQGAGQEPQLRSRVRRGSEGYEVRPMMYDRAYAAQVEEEEERLRAYLMRERERLGPGVRDWTTWSPGAGDGAGEGSMAVDGGARHEGRTAPAPLLPSQVMARRQEELGAAVWTPPRQVDVEDVNDDEDDEDAWGTGEGAEEE